MERYAKNFYFSFGAFFFGAFFFGTFFFGTFLFFCFSAFCFLTTSRIWLDGFGHIASLYSSGTSGRHFLYRSTCFIGFSPGGSMTSTLPYFKNLVLPALIAPDDVIFILFKF